MVFIRLDIARFTKFSEDLQPRVIAELNELVHAELTNPEVWGDQKPKKPSRTLSTGDGFILAYDMPSGDASPWPLALAQRIAHVLDCANDSRVPINFRISVTCGPVYVTGDLQGNVNYAGKAITETERLLQCIPQTQDDVVCFSEGVYRKYRNGISAMKFYRHGFATDKHGEVRRVYLLEYNDEL